MALSGSIWRIELSGIDASEEEMVEEFSCIWTIESLDIVVVSFGL
jgi:hypothetical protein